MSTKRRVIGISAAATEAARRQLMQPVACWERTWVPLEGSKIQILKWIKTEKVQQFSDDEGAVDEPLAPLPEEQDVEIVEVEGDEEAMLIDQEAGTQESLVPPANTEDVIAEAVVDSVPLSGITSQVDVTEVREVDSSKATSPALEPQPLQPAAEVADPELYAGADDFSTVNEAAFADIPEAEAPPADIGLGEGGELDMTGADVALALGEDGGLSLGGDTSMGMIQDDGLGMDIPDIDPSTMQFTAGEHDLSQLGEENGLLADVMMEQPLNFTEDLKE